MPRRSVRTAAGLTVAVLVAPVATLAACGGGSVQAGPDGGSAACTALVDRLPARVLDRARAALDVPGAAAWGDPAVVLRCGVPATGPTDDPCIDADGLDWTFRETDGGYRFTTYGRRPTVEVTVPSAVERTAATGALVDLAGAVRPLASSARCT